MVEFLDLQIFLENGRLETNLFIKPSNLQLFLDFKSNHPKHCKIGIVYGQALRIIERCSEQVDANLHLESLKVKLIDRNYPVQVIENQFARAKKKNRRQTNSVFIEMLQQLKVSLTLFYLHQIYNDYSTQLSKIK